MPEGTGSQSSPRPGNARGHKALPSKQQATMLSMSARLARSLTGSRVKTKPVLDPLVSIHRSIHPKADIQVIERAYDTAERLHEGVYRKSGDPYITHPLAVATIVAEIGMDTTTVVAALLHDLSLIHI